MLSLCLFLKMLFKIYRRLNVLFNSLQISYPFTFNSESRRVVDFGSRVAGDTGIITTVLRRDMGENQKAKLVQRFLLNLQNSTEVEV